MACPYHKTAAPAPVAPVQTGQTMKAIYVEAFGGPNVLKLKDIPMPVPRENEILIKVFTIGVNPVDSFCRKGFFPSRVREPPFIPGGDVAGVVQQVGNKVTKFVPGEQVYTFGRALKGGYAQYAVFPDTEVFRLHEDMQFSQGAAIGIPYFTAYKALFMIAKAKSGDHVLIHGASGGVGIAACQIARAKGLQVWGTAGSEQGMELILKKGAHRAFNHREEGYISQIKKSTAGKGIDVILEMALHKNFVSDLELLAEGGCIIDIACTSPEKHAAVKSIRAQESNDEELAEIGAALYSGMEEGWLRPVIGGEYPLAEAEEAHRRIESQLTGSTSGSLGKVILSV